MLLASFEFVLPKKCEQLAPFNDTFQLTDTVKIQPDAPCFKVRILFLPEIIISKRFENPLVQIFRKVDIH